MTNTNLTAFIIICICLVIASCNKYDDYEGYNNYTDSEWSSIEPYLNLPINVYQYFYRRNPDIPSKEDRIITLGRVLFYDKDLSVDGSVSCGSCHKQELAFSDNVSFSKGANGNLTLRNSYPIGSFYLLSSTYGSSDYTERLFWDKRANDMIEQLDETFSNPLHMGIPQHEITSRVVTTPYYQTLFKLANLEPNSKNVNTALHAFIGTLNSKKSRFDQARAYHSANGNLLTFMSITDTLNFTASEDKGKKLFNTHCNTCHQVNLRPGKSHRTTGAEANNGLDNKYQDKGRGSVLNLDRYEGVFKVPQLRNIAQTAPYMHDGRFATIDDVIDFYSSGIQDHRNLDRRLRDKNDKPTRFNFTESEKADLVNFLHTLTDNNLLTHEKWSDPFKK